MGPVIQSLLIQHDWTQKRLADVTGISSQGIGHIISGRNSATPRNAAKIAHAFGLSLAELQVMVTDSGVVKEGMVEHTKSPKTTRDASAAFIGEFLEPQYVNLTFITILARATFAEMSSSEQDHEQFDTIAVPVMPGESVQNLLKCKVFEVNGDSMEPTIIHGQRVVVEPIPESRWEYQSDRVYVISYAGMVVIKRIKTNHLAQSGRLELWSDNEKKGGMKTALRQDIQGIWKVLRLDRAPEIY